MTAFDSVFITLIAILFALFLTAIVADIFERIDGMRSATVIYGVALVTMIVLIVFNL